MLTQILTAILFMISLPLAHFDTDINNGTVKGAIYDLNGAIIINLPICIENVLTGETKIVKVDPMSGTYSASVPSGRYRARLIQIVGYPVGEDRASFEVPARKDIVINFRPTPIAVTSVIENGKYTSKYDGDFPSAITHFVPQSSGLAIKDIRVWFKTLSVSGKNHFRYNTATASYENFMISGSVITYDSSNRQLIAEGKVLFEDGVRSYALKKVTLDLIKSTVNTETNP